MSEEIKFKAWLPAIKEMIELPFAALQYFDFEGSYAMSFVVDGYSGFWAHEHYESTTKENCKGAVIRRFAGLTDNNGEDVYEGDLVKLYEDGAEDARPIISEVKFKDGAFYPKPSDCVFGVYEVIGNIYENPELLNAPA
jgi:hypothetical protein